MVTPGNEQNKNATQQRLANGFSPWNHFMTDESTREPIYFNLMMRWSVRLVAKRNDKTHATVTEREVFVHHIVDDKVEA